MELKIILQNVADSYEDFVLGMMNYAKYSSEREERLITYVKENPHALSSDIIEYVSNQPDFYDDASEETIEEVIIA
ncbi:MAG: hypothetical protein IJT16_04570 [Lachnospiraceae bacterium]|nr:hypothetical protein [Lachnospiraceae bacterium]